MKTAIQLQDEARRAAKAGDETRLMEAQAELINRFVIGQRIEAIRVQPMMPESEDMYPVRIELENHCAILFFGRGPNPFAILTTRPE